MPTLWNFIGYKKTYRFYNSKMIIHNLDIINENIFLIRAKEAIMLNPFTLWQLSFTTLHSTVKSLLDGHQWDPKKLSFQEKCPVNRNSPPTNRVSVWKRYLLNGVVCYGRFHCISVWVIYMFLSEKIISNFTNEGFLWLC